MATHTPNRSDFIRSQIAKNVVTSAIIAGGAAQGLRITEGLIYKVRARLKKNAKKAGKAVAAAAPKAGNNASDFVRAQPSSMPVREVVAKGKAAGLSFSPALVYLLRQKAAVAPASAKPVAAKPVAAKPVAATGNSDAAFKRLAFELGLARSHALLDDLERGLASLLG